MGALLTFASPIAGYDGTTAYIDIAVACVLFTVFYLLQIWDQERTPALEEWGKNQQERTSSNFAT